MKSYELIASSENSNWTMTQKIKKRESLETATEQKIIRKLSEILETTRVQLKIEIRHIMKVDVDGG
jgi:hypothetical protein